MLGLKSIRIITLMGVEHVTDDPLPLVFKVFSEILFIAEW